MILAEKFRRSCEELASFIEQEGMAVRPYVSENLSYFQLLGSEAQKEVTLLLEEYLATARILRKAKSSLKDSVLFVKEALQYYSFDHHPDLFQYVNKPQVVTEFYSLRSTQFFRTFNYFELTSYTIEDMYCRQWVHLYQRPQEIIEKMYTQIQDMVIKADPLGSIIVAEPHIVKERVSLERLEVKFQNMHIFPLCQKGKIVALSACTEYLK